MKKGIILFGPAQSGKLHKANEIAATYPEGKVKILYFNKPSQMWNKFAFSICELDTELIIIVDVQKQVEIEYFFHVLTGPGLLVHKQRVGSFVIKPKVLIIYADDAKMKNLHKGASFDSRFDTYLFPESADLDIEFEDIELPEYRINIQ